MTSRERVLAALRREPVDRTPLVNPTSIATVELMDLADAPFPDANREPELMARLAATGHTELGFDSIMPVFSIIQESSALGCKIQWEQKDNWPTVKMKEPIYETPDDIRIPDDLLDHPGHALRASTRSSSCAQQFGDEVAIIGKTMGPWSLAYHTFGVEPFLLMSLDDPGQDGARASTGSRRRRSSSARRRSRPAPTRSRCPTTRPATSSRATTTAATCATCTIEFAEELDAPIILHICGRTVDRMGYIAETGMAAFHYDSKNGAAESMEAVDGRISLVGNVNNPATLYSQGPGRGARRGSREPRRRHPHDRARSARSPCRRRSRACSRSATPSPSGMTSSPLAARGATCLSSATSRTTSCARRSTSSSSARTSASG